MNWIKEKLLSASMYWELEKMKWARSHPEIYTQAFEESKRYCKLCNEPAYEDYMLKDELWLAHFNNLELVHLQCFEKNLGRPLEADDFSPAPINNNIRWALTRN